MYDILSDLIITGTNSVVNIFTEKKASDKRVKRKCWAIVLKYEGETVYECNGKRYISNISNAVILPKGSTYKWQCTDAGHFYSLEFECDTEYDKIIKIPLKNSSVILSKLKNMEYKLVLKNKFYLTESMADTYEILIYLLKSTLKKYVPNNKQAKIQPSVDYMTKNFNRKISNKFLASLSECSTVYFRKLFCEIYGIPPIKYINNLRITKAKEILSSDYSSISDVAFTVGYSSIYDFSRAFKARTGVSPSEFARELR